MKHPRTRLTKEQQRIRYASIEYQREQREIYEDEDIVVLSQKLKDLKRWDKQRRKLWVKYGKWNEKIAKYRIRTYYVFHIRAIEDALVNKVADQRQALREIKESSGDKRSFLMAYEDTLKQVWYWNNVNLPSLQTKKIMNLLRKSAKGFFSGGPENRNEHQPQNRSTHSTHRRQKFEWKHL